MQPHHAPRRGSGRASSAAARPAAVAVPAVKPDAGQKYIYLVWFTLLFDPQWMLAVKAGATPLLKLPTIMLAILLGIVIIKAKSKYWFLPIIMIFGYMCAILPFTYNRGYALTPTKQVFAYAVMCVGTVAMIHNARLVKPLIIMCLLGQYVWLMPWGAQRGLVQWHPAYNNEDGFGPLMVIGIGACFFFGMSAKSKKWKWFGLAMSGACVFGVISSFARGAVVAAGCVLAWIWWRSPRKGLTTLIMAGIAVVVMGGAKMVEGQGQKRGGVKASFWDEMATINDAGGTRSDREVLWGLAVRVWKENPVFGVGPENFGPYAAENFQAGTVGGQYGHNPGMLYTRKLHSTFYQILCEFGIVGSSLFVWLMLDWWYRNRLLRKKNFIEAWNERSGGEFDLKQLSYAIETAMIGWLLTGVFYNQIFNVHWLWSLVALNALLWSVSQPPRKRRVKAAPLPQPVVAAPLPAT